MRGDFMYEINVLVKRDRKAFSSFSLPCENTKKRWLSTHKEDALTRRWVGIFILDFQAHPVYGIWSQQPKLAKTAVLVSVLLVLSFLSYLSLFLLIHFSSRYRTNVLLICITSYLHN